ncbi:hypothetical protein [uncultured Arsenicicoccus sp.]|uniref:hypothetical protein n=1 Tax=uncultured Arsenicicoccus sp. TaxID=491339 RepID=UPI002599E349|nr:hypothetical protein [uncultured Arsenicicoccus sp.]
MTTSQHRAMTSRTSSARRFVLARDRDVSGVSGIGVVAEGVQWSDGTVSMRWLGDRASTVTHDSIDNVTAIHGHDGATRVVWLDEL